MSACAGASAVPLNWAVGRMMSDQQVAEVINYVRSHFGNRYKERVSAAQVAQLPHPTAAAAP